MRVVLEGIRIRWMNVSSIIYEIALTIIIECDVEMRNDYIDIVNERFWPNDILLPGRERKLICI